MNFDNAPFFVPPNTDLRREKVIPLSEIMRKRVFSPLKPGWYVWEKDGDGWAAKGPFLTKDEAQPPKV